MTSINVHLRPSAREGHAGKLFIRIIRARQSRQISTGYALYGDEWDMQGKRLLFSPADTTESRERQDQLTLIDESMKSDLRHLQGIVARLEESGDYTVSDVAARFTESLGGDTVWGYAQIAASRLREQGQERTARAYRSAARSLAEFNGGREIHLSEIDASLVRAYEQRLIEKGLKMNTVSFYLRNLRALYFRAVREKLIPRQEVSPFAGLHTGVYETRRRALDNDQLKALAALEISLLEQLEALERTEAADSDRLADERAIAEPGCLADDRTTAAVERRKTSALHDSLLLFLFCYHARGMSFVDMAYLKQEDVGAETLTYRRRKTGGMLEVKVTEPMSEILSHFTSRTRHSGYVFPVIDSGKGFAHRQYETGLKRQNRQLKTLAAMAGIAENLSTHAARHTWATLAKRMQVPVAVIGEALGHRDVKTTSIYLASFDRATMDELSARLSEAAKAA